MTTGSIATTLRTTGLTVLMCGAVTAVTTAERARAADWPQWGGPDRNFTVQSAGLSTDWPAKGPKQLWSRKLGDGYSGISVVGDTLYTMYHNGRQECVIAIGASDGKTTWEHCYDVQFYSGLDRSFGVGPRSTPLVTNDHVFSAGITGLLHCIDRKTGKVVWSHDLMRDYGATQMRWGYASSPIAFEQLVILPVGGHDHGVMAFEQKTGAVAWSQHDFVNGYSSPILIDLDGEQQLVMFVADGVVGLNPRNGGAIWSFAHETNYDINASTPIWLGDNILFLSSAYDTGSRALKLGRSNGKTNVEQLWFTPKMKIHFGSAIRVGDLIYGSSGGNGPVFLSAVNVKTGKMAFRKRGIVAKAQLIYADGKLIMIDEEGNLVIATPKADGVVVHAKVKLLDRVSWTGPTLVGTKLFIRDKKTIKALDLG